MKKVFLDNGKRWNERTELKVKNIVADVVKKEGFNSINQHKTEPIYSLIKALEEKIKIINDV